MTHTVTGKLNKSARTHQSQSGTTFFVSLGEKNFNYKTKQNEWTNYDAAIFAKDGQVDFYNSALIEGAVVSVSGTGLIAVNEEQYGIKLSIQDAKLVYVNTPQGQSQQQAAPRQQAPQYAQPVTQQAPPQQAPQYAPPQQQVAPQQAPFDPSSDMHF